MYLNIKRQQGLGLPIAIFIIVIMSLIAVAVNKISESSAESYAQAVLTSRVFYAAESGIQLKLVSVLSTPTCTCGTTPETFSFTTMGLSGCSAVVSCELLPIAGGPTYCTLTSAGTCVGSNAQRVVEVRVK